MDNDQLGDSVGRGSLSFQCSLAGLLLAVPLVMGAGDCNWGQGGHHGGRGRRCTYAGRFYAAGEGFPATDGCNTCSCTQDGRVTCTLLACPVRPCGGLTGRTCPANEYCHYPEQAQCGAGDQSGSCALKPDVCDDLYEPVCGCDGTTYSNACEAAAAGVSVAQQGACEGEADCSAIPQCEFVCPEGQVNPVDEDGCVHTCECVDSELKWYLSCGDPVCGLSPDPFDSPDIPNCSGEKVGDVCTTPNARCDGVADCGMTLVCTDRDPTAQLGGCPISRARFKQDIRYLSEAQRREVYEQVVNLPLASYHYRSAPKAPLQLGFIIEDIEPSAAVRGDRVNLYGYLSMAVAAIQEQQTQIQRLEQELQQVRGQLAEDGPAPMCMKP